ncbi:hypothetical protein WJX77_011141 [Trebouxia sp. C0004]
MRLNDLVLQNNINSGKFFEACATVRSQRSGKKDPDLAATAKALEAAAKAGRAFSSHIKANPVGIIVAGKQPVSKPKSVSLAALGPDAEPVPWQELHSASNPFSFHPSLLLQPSIKPSSCSDAASSHLAAVKAARGRPVLSRYPVPEVDYLDSKENRSLVSSSRSTGHMTGSSSNSPQVFSKAEAASMIAKLRSRSAGCTSAGQARSSKSSGASSTEASLPLQTKASRAIIAPLLAIKGQLRALSKAAPAPPQAATGNSLSDGPFTFASPAAHSLQCGHKGGSRPGQFVGTQCRVQPTPAGPPQSTAPFVMTAEPSFGLCSFPPASAIRQLRASGTAASQLSMSCAAGTVFYSEGGTVEATHMAAAASQLPPSETPTPLGSEAAAAAAADAATAWADQLIGSPGGSTTDVAEPELLDVVRLLHCTALHEDADAPRPMPASPSAASEASCASGFSAYLDAALDDSPNPSGGTQASAEQSLTRYDLGAQSPAALSSPCSSCQGREADQETALSAGSSSALLEAALDRQTIASHPDSECGPAFSPPTVPGDQILKGSWSSDDVLDDHNRSQAAASVCQSEVLSPSCDLDFLTTTDLVRLDAYTLQHDATLNIAKFEDSLHLLDPCSEVHDLQRVQSARPYASLNSSSADTAGHMSVDAEGFSFMHESRVNGLQQQARFPSALYESSQSESVSSEDGPLASSGQGTSGDTPTTAHACAPLGPDHSPEAAEGTQDLGVSMHGVLSHLTFQDMEGIFSGESP